MRRLFLLLLLCWVSVVVRPQTLPELSETINDKLLNLKNEIRNWNDDLLYTTAQLEAASVALKTSEAEVLLWKERSTSLSNSLDNISSELTSSYMTITQLRQQLQTTVKLVVILSALLVIRGLMYVAGVILYVKGIKVPRWVDILL